MCDLQGDKVAPEFQQGVNPKTSRAVALLLIDTPTRSHGLVNSWRTCLGVFTVNTHTFSHSCNFLLLIKTSTP